MLTSRIEKIAKKLSIFTIDDISVILEEPEDVIAKNLQELTGYNRLKFNNEKYFYIEPIREKPKKKKKYKRKEIIYEDYNQTLIDSLISFFCAEVETSKVALMLKTDRVLIELFYADFRKLIYEYQLNELHSVFKEKPKLPVKRTYLDTTLCLYEYDRKLFVSKDILIAKDLKNPTKQEFLNIKVINSMLIRRFEKCCHKFFVEHRTAEHIWRRNKKYPAMLKELTKLIEEHSQAV